MKKLARTVGCAVAAGALVLSGAACQKPKQAASADGPCAGETLRISQATDGSMLYIADEIAAAKGMFAKQGLTIDRIALGGGSEAVQALVGGSADVTLSTHPTVLSTREKGGPVLTFATVMDSLLYGLTMKSDIAPEEESEEAVVDALRGKKVGITSAGSSTDRIMRYMFLQHGLDPDKDVEIVATGGSSEMVASFARGSIDAYVISPPASIIGAEKGDGEVALDLSDGTVPAFDDILWLTALTSKEALDKKKEALVCYSRALNKAVELIHSDPEQAKKAVRKKYEQLSDEQFEEAFDQVVSATPKSVAVDPADADAAYRFEKKVEPRMKAPSEESYTTTVTDQVTK